MLSKQKRLIEHFEANANDDRYIHRTMLHDIWQEVCPSAAFATVLSYYAQWRRQR